MKDELTAIVKILGAVYEDKLNHIFNKQELKTMVEGLGFKLAILVQHADDNKASEKIYDLIATAEYLDDEVKEKLK